MQLDVAVFSTKSYDRSFLDAANARGGSRHRLSYFEPRLGPDTATLAAGSNAVCAFVNDRPDQATLAVLRRHEVKLVALRCAGFNNVDLMAARQCGITIARLSAYSPEAVAEHTVALILALDRKIHRAYARVREGNFALEGLLGFNIAGRTFGVVGAGRIGLAAARIMRAFGCTVLACDPMPDPELQAAGGRYVSLPDLLAQADIISLHCPLTRETRHLIDARATKRMKQGVMLINTSRGAVIETKAVIAGLKSGKIGYLGLDVYEEEGDLFFEDLSDQVLEDDVFARLLTFPNVLITGHQGFFTNEALTAIAETTIANLTRFEETGQVIHEVSTDMLG
jgi:D-lactate dehydrogenase